MILDNIIAVEKPMLLLTVGASGSGKTQFVKELQKREDFININNDDLRMSLFGITEWKDYDFDKNENLIDILRGHCLLESMETRRNVIISNLNLSDFHIKNYKRLAEQNGYRVCVILFDISLDVCIRRNNERRQMKLRESVIVGQYQKFCKLFDYVTQYSVIPYYVITKEFQEEIQESKWEILLKSI